MQRLFANNWHSLATLFSVGLMETYCKPRLLQPISIAVSSCLLGELVRYDGKMKPSPWVFTALQTPVKWVSICPEAGAGLGTPRPPVDLFYVNGRIQMKTLDMLTDHTETVCQYCIRWINDFSKRQICGYVLKSRSPSCGILDADIHGSTSGKGDGLMVQMLRALIPDLPIVRDEDLLVPSRIQRFELTVLLFWKKHYEQSSQELSSVIHQK